MTEALINAVLISWAVGVVLFLRLWWINRKDDGKR